MNDPIQPLVDEISRRLNLTEGWQNELKNSMQSFERQQADKLIDLENRIKALVIEADQTNKQIEIVDKRIDPLKPETLNLGKQHKMFPLLLSYVNLGLPVYIYGPTGSGKTMGAVITSQALKTNYYRIALCAQTSKSELLGYNDAHGNYVAGIAYEPYINGGLLLLDELDNGNANVNSVLNMFTDGSDCVFPCGRRTKHKDFRVIATANTIGNGATRQYVGRAPQDRALLNRLPKIQWGYDIDFERYISEIEYQSYGGKDKKEFMQLFNDFQKLRKAIDELQIDHILSTRNLIHVCRMKASGINITDITRSIIFAGLDKDQAIKIKNKTNALTSNSPATIIDVVANNDDAPF